MNKKFNLKFSFKGNRKYIQGPDIFEAVIKQLKNEFHYIKKIKYTAYKMLHRNATMYITKKVIKDDYPIINSLISFISNEVKYYVVISENNDIVKNSIEYNENVVNNTSKIFENTILFTNIISDSYSEIIVSMNKYFLNQTVKKKGKWIVTKFDFFDLNDITDIKNKEIKIELIQNFNNKLTKSTLFIDKKLVGHLYFSLIEEEL